MTGAAYLAAQESVKGRVDIWEAEQFIAANVFEQSQLRGHDLRLSVEDLVTRYNDVVEECETDSSLKIEVG